MWLQKVVILLIFVFSVQSTAKSTELIDVPVLIAEDVKLHLQRLSKQTDILTISDFSNLPQGRDLVDVILLNQALHLGKCQCRLVYFDNSVYGRNIELLKSGKYALSADTLWLSDITSHATTLRSSQAVIRNGEYDVGLYTSVNNERALKAQNKEDISRLTAISNRFWSADWQAINQLNPIKLAHIESFPNMKRLVKSEIADFTLLHFRINDDDLSFEQLTPIPNVKAVLWDSRHFAISTQFPNYQRIADALNKGLEQLHRENKITSAYLAVGINHPLTSDWKILNASDAPNYQIHSP
ncbi:hypothetical protein [Pseudoalteromonas spongiae]|uniref:Solute-binding protein family 3/N-terminal domain-containing protein n=1 Tax=Pseudoalteromonas spongiae TaxID=298657 RepID=A0ABU8ES12_9GAMM